MDKNTEFEIAKTKSELMEIWVNPERFTNFTTVDMSKYISAQVDYIFALGERAEMQKQLDQFKGGEIK